ncbi:MAG TPA: RdgB/HAM1 family non-canonical purine NTP pyrophosphatase [Thermomicrobiales bacterium]|nr:RdgB/HAM1 family non-canonical purine NTP pyrophosphatase [Thermomicrobiales bacterium]
MKVIVATNNRGKLEELRALLPDGLDLLTLSDAGLDSPEESGTTFEENALIKARAAAPHADAAFADDSGLVVDALDGRPGVWSSRFAGPAATDADNNARLLAELSDVSDDDRTARFVSVVALVTSDGHEFIATGCVEGRIGRQERGAGGFGYDPLMIVADPNAVEFIGLTMAELSVEQKNLISHRARAYRELLSVLREAGFSFGMADDSSGVTEG